MEIPRSNAYMDKKIASADYVQINETKYIRRIFECGAAELVRYDEKNEKWVFLCFKAPDKEVKAGG